MIYNNFDHSKFEDKTTRNAALTVCGVIGLALSGMATWYWAINW